MLRKFYQMKKISINELRPGMVVVKLDNENVFCPFFGKKLTDFRSVTFLKEAGIKHVFIEDEIDTSVEEAAAYSPANLSNPRDIKRARLLHGEGMSIAKNMFQNIKNGEKIDYNTASKFVCSVVEESMITSDILVTMNNLGKLSEYDYYHAVNVCILSITIGKKLGLSKLELKELGNAAFFHDIGKSKIDEKILHKPGKLTDEEFAKVKQHPQLSCDILKESTSVPVQILKAIAQHHERSDGTGYPKGLKERDISEYAKIISIADVYDAATSDKSYRECQTPVQALKFIFSWSGRQFNEALVKFFISLMGVYPVGTTVNLDSGEYAVVIEVNKSKSMMPKVLVVTDSKGELIEPYVCNLADINLMNHKPLKRIIAAVNPTMLGINPDMMIDSYLEKAHADTRVR